MRARILHRYNEANYWAELNPILGEGEIGIESDTNLCKIGDGKTLWNDLPFAGGDGKKRFIQSLAYVPKQSLNGNHRGQMVYTYTGPLDKKTDRVFMFLNKTVNGITTCELIPISYFALIRDQVE